VDALWAANSTVQSGKKGQQVNNGDDLSLVERNFFTSK